MTKKALFDSSGTRFDMDQLHQLATLTADESKLAAAFIFLYEAYERQRDAPKKYPIDDDYFGWQKPEEISSYPDGTKVEVRFLNDSQLVSTIIYHAKGWISKSNTKPVVAFRLIKPATKQDPATIPQILEAESVTMDYPVPGQSRLTVKYKEPNSEVVKEVRFVVK